MKVIFSAIVLFLVSFCTAAAYELHELEVVKPYEVIEVEKYEINQQVYLGELKDFPVMYEVVLSEESSLSISLSQLNVNQDEIFDFSLIVIKEDEIRGGVEEVVRIHPDADWEIKKDSKLGMTFLESEQFTKLMEPGTYRIEVSTPVNKGKYRLVIGEEVGQAGYFKTLGQIRTTQDFFGYSFFKMLTSSYVYYPLGILILLFIIHRTWKLRKTISNVD